MKKLSKEDEHESPAVREQLMEDLDEVILSSDSQLLKNVGLSVWQAQMAGLDSTEDYEQVNIARTIEHLVTHSEIIREALAHERLMIVGARYRLDSGLVEVLSF